MEKYKVPYALSEIKFDGISVKCKHQLFDLLVWLEDSLSWASKETHYQNLEVWWKAYNDKIRTYLNINGFKNGDKEYNDNLPDVRFWWTIYGYDPTLSPDVATHHASAFERATTALLDLNHLYEQITKVENFLLLVEKSDGTTEAINKWHIENRLWLRKSQKIALKIMDALEKQGLDKSILPNPNVVYGLTDLKLSEISQIEKLLKIKL